MSAENHFLRMALNNAWANATLYGTVDSLTPDSVWAQRPGFFGSIGRTLNHIYEVDLFYVDALTDGGKGRSVYGRDDIRDAKDLGVAQSEIDMTFAMFCGNLNDEALIQTRDTERPEGMVQERVDRLVLHLVQHQIHHRGQVHAMLSHAGIDPPQLDDFYLEHGRVPSAAAYWS